MLTEFHSGEGQRLLYIIARASIGYTKCSVRVWGTCLQTELLSIGSRKHVGISTQQVNSINGICCELYPASLLKIECTYIASIHGPVKNFFDHLHLEIRDELTK